MEQNTKIKIIERFDCYYAGINNKGIFILTFNTFLIGAFIAGYDSLIKSIDCAYLPAAKILIALALLMTVVSQILSVFSIIPYMGSDKINKSNWFFNDIATLKKEDFIEKIDSVSVEHQTKDINTQIYYLATGLRKKHWLIKLSLISNLIGIVCIIPVVSFVLF